MKELSQIFTRRYSAVSTKDDNINFEHLHDQHRKSLQPTRGINQGFSIVNSFFNERKVGKRTRLPKRGFLLMATGLLAIAIAILVKMFHPYEQIFKWKLVFGEDGEIFNLWEKPPVDLYIKIYLFNITNSEDFLAGKDKMRVEEVGPYVYKEAMFHDDIVFNDNNTLTTKPRHPLIWQEEMSEGRREDDVLMMVNIALLSIAQVAADRSYFFRLPINLLIRQTKSQPIVKMTAREFMFGYETSLTTIGNTLLPDWISFDRVGLIDRMYDFSSDYETFYTGEDDASISGLYDTYRGSKKLPQWKGDHCSDISMASDGTKFKSYLEPNDTVLFFRKSMCRPQRMIRTGDELLVSNLAAYKYVFEENALDNGYYDERNKCYCRNNYCQPRGLVDVTDCYYGFPISLSYPHFMDADPKIREDVIGSYPNRSLHESYFLIQPKSGLPLHCSVKFQINMHMKNVKPMAHVERFSHITIPMVWFEITLLELPEPLRNRFNLYLNVLTYIDSVGFWLPLVGGILCLLFTVTRAAWRISSVIPPNENNPCDKTKYSDANLRSSVYKACEMKLIHSNNEKSSTQHPSGDNVITCEIDLTSNENNYILEREPAISDDEGNDSDSSSRNSGYKSDSCSGGDDRNHSHNQHHSKDQVSQTSSGFESRDRSQNGYCQMGETSSLIEDIGNDHFPSLMVSESYNNMPILDEYKNKGSNL